MKRHRPKLAASALLAILAGTTGALALEQKISCAAVPAAVRAAFENAYPRATMKECAREVEKGKTVYEISSMEGKTGRDVDYHPDGTVIAVEETIAFGSVPEAVQQAVHKRYPGGRITRSEKIMRDDAILYEFRIKHGSKSVEIVLDPAGNEVKP